MAYTVQELATLTGVSIRTLHCYDEIGLLKPAYRGSNGYRYYEEAQLLKLQHILFFRKLEFSLKDIQHLLEKNIMHRIEALERRRSILEKEVHQKNTLIDLIDKAMHHLQEESTS